MIDPLIVRIISIGFALLFLIAAAHKLANRAHFRASFDAYKIVPVSLSGSVTTIIPLLELLLGLAWLSLGLFAIEFRAATLISIVLLASYALAIAINLKRGRYYIDCGCSFISNRSESSQQISLGMVYRNTFFIAMAAACLLPVSVRSLQLVDSVGLAFSSLALTLIYGTYNQLLSNRGAINSWRRANA